MLTHRNGDLTKGRSRNTHPFLLSRDFAAVYRQPRTAGVAGAALTG